LIFIMRTFCFIVLVTLSGIAMAQDVMITLTGKHKGVAVELDTIILENLTQPDTVILYPLPTGITSYQIDLRRGKIINGIGEYIDLFGVFLEINKPGYQKVKVVLQRSESLKFTLFSLTGKAIWQETIQFREGSSCVDINSGSEPLYLLRVQGVNFDHCFKCPGSPGSTGGFAINQFTTCTVKKASQKFGGSLIPFEFVYSPGDQVKFTAIKTGMYPGFKVEYPVNLDSISIQLAATPCAGQTVVYDYDQNSYATVQIGNQCWLRENLRSVHYADGAPLVDGTNAGNIAGNYQTKYWFDYDNDPFMSLIYGKLYSGAAFMNGVRAEPWDTNKYQGICPNGWHVPNDYEWMRMEAFLGMMGDTNGMFMWRGTDQGKKLKEQGLMHWIEVNNGTNESGFTGIPGGIRSNSGEYHSLGTQATWWTGTSLGDSGIVRALASLTSQIYKGLLDYDRGLSCRCIKD
jgi:uncharacterized protein (TIGR02145 family)